MAPAGRPYLSVVIPAYNEERRLGDSLTQIFRYLEQGSIDSEILVVDDGSVDATAKIAADLLKGHRGRVVKNGENRGKGYSVRHGVLEASGRWVLMSDSDLSTPISEHARLAAAARDQDLDVVIGSRGMAESNIEIRQNLLRETMGKTFNKVVRAMAGLSFHDTQCGFKLMDRVRVKPLFEKMVIHRFAFDVELLFLCTRFGLRVGEIPVTWRNSPDSRVGILSDPINMLWDVACMRWRFRRGGYLPD